LLELVGMGALAGRAIGQLSGGQQQRVALARALAINPSALLLDEPLAALDASIRGHLRDLIRELQQRFSATTLLVTHDQEEALTMADRVAVLQDGRLLQLATPREIYERPNSVAVARFVGRATLLAATIAGPGELDLGYARLKVDTGNRASGAAVHALIRPEHIVPDPPVGTLNRLPGHCGTRRYLGSGVRYDFHPEGAAQALLAESAQVATRSVAIAPEHIHLLDH
jgi:putative spermidine/putrescine transport system ATP-binding protein